MKRFSLFVTYAAMNILLVLLPIIAFTAMIYTNAFKQIRNEMITMQTFSLTQAMEGIDNTVEGFTAMSSYASSDSELTPYQLKKGFYSTMSALRRLGMHTVTINMSQVYIYIDSQKMLYGPDGNISLDYFIKLHTFHGEWNRDDLLDLLRNPSDTSLSPSGCTISRNTVRGESYVLLVSPWNNSGVQYGTFIGMIEHAYFQKMLENVLTDHESMAFILDEEGNSLFEVSSGPADKMLENITKLDGSEGRFSLNDKEYTYIQTLSSVNGWRYIVLIPKAKIFESLINENTYQFFIILLLFMACLLAGIVLASHYYKPIRKIWQILLGQPMPETSKTRPSQTTQIQMRVSEIVRQNRSIAHELDEKKESLRQNTLIQLIDGDFQNTGDRFGELKQIGILLTGPCYQVVVLSLGEAVTISLRNEVYQALRTVYSLCVETLQKYIVVLLNTDKAEPGLQEDLERLSAIIKEHGTAYHRMGLGQAYDDPALIHVSYIEALAALESNEKSEVISFDSIFGSSCGKTQVYPDKAQLRLTEAVIQGNVTALAPIIEEISNQLHAAQSSLDCRWFRFSLYSIIHDLLQATQKNPLDSIHWEINRLLHYGDLEDFLEKLNALCVNLAMQVRDSRARKKNDLLSKILCYIDMHYFEADISLTDIAERFNLTNSTLSRLFSDCFEVRFIDYLSDKRLDKSTELLLRTDMGIKEIVTQVGYIDVSSFTRKFTQKYGISPGKYRQNNKRNTV